MHHILFDPLAKREHPHPIFSTLLMNAVKFAAITRYQLDAAPDLTC